MSAAAFSKRVLTDVGATDADSESVDTLGSAMVGFYAVVKGAAAWDRAGTLYLESSPDGVTWPLAAQGTGTTNAIRKSIAVLATDDDRVFFDFENAPARFVRLRWDNTTAGTGGTLDAYLVVSDYRFGGWN